MEKLSQCMARSKRSINNIWSFFIRFTGWLSKPTGLRECLLFCRYSQRTWENLQNRDHRAHNHSVWRMERVCSWWTQDWRNVTFLGSRSKSGPESWGGHGTCPTAKACHLFTKPDAPLEWGTCRITSQLSIPCAKRLKAWTVEPDFLGFNLCHY